MAISVNKRSLSLVADPGQNSDSRIIWNSRIYHPIIKNQINLPEPVEIYGSGKACNVCIGIPA